MSRFIAHHVALTVPLAAVALLAPATSAFAQFTDLPAGGIQVALNPVVIPEEGSQLLTSMSQPFAFTFNGNAQFTNGNVSSAVFERTNGFLDFVYQINVTTASGGITALNITDFGDFTTSVGFNRDTDIDGPAPNFAAGANDLRPFRSSRPSQGTIQFTFNGSQDGDISTGERSAVLVIRTNATNFELGTGAISAPAAGNVLVFVPSSIVVPEAGTLAFLIPGIALGAVMLRRREK